MNGRPTHPQLVNALVKSPYDIVVSLTPYTADLWHGATGVAGETGELLEGLANLITMGITEDTLAAARINVVEESGDIYFYTEQLVQRTGIELDWDAIACFARNQHIGPDRIMHEAVWVAIHGSQVLDTVKKAAVYNKELVLKLLDIQLTEMCKHLMVVGYMFGVERQEALRENIDKLLVRYDGMKYSDAAAQQRADKVA